MYSKVWCELEDCQHNVKGRCQEIKKSSIDLIKATTKTEGEWAQPHYLVCNSYIRKGNISTTNV